VSALALNLDAMGFYPRTHAVFGAMADKDLAAVVQRLCPIVEHWYCTDLPLPRAARADALADVVRGVQPQAQVSTHASPSRALAAAVERADPADRILIFGSFLTVGGVLEDGLPRLGAQHRA
jgi:dihydrofolate synthase/folylpolyglutamate synthase